MSSEPAAWGILRVGAGWVSILANEVQAETSRKSFDKTENLVHEVVPLYRSPALTAAEREAVEWYGAYGAGDHAATLRALLGRLA